MKKITTISFLGILFVAIPAFGDNFRCSISTVAVKCDPPAGMFKREEPVETEISRGDGRNVRRNVYIEVQEWTYTQGATLLHTLFFRNGILSEVRTGGFVR